ncbi:MAG: hydroxypyruvate isomerase family protein [Planctomycetota bacterium]
MQRREFLSVSTAATVGAAVGAGRLSASSAAPEPARGPRRGAFHLKYAPHFGMFDNHAPDLLDQLQFAADEGFIAWEDNGMGGREPAMQEKIAAKMQGCGIEMGVFVAHAAWQDASFAGGRKEHADRVLADMQAAVEVADRVGAKWCTVVPGLIEPRLDWGYQMANTVDLLKRCVEITGPKDLTLVLEPLNFRDHPRLFLTKIAQGYELCRAVGSPHCKILDDLYHQQVTEGNLIPNIDRAWSEIGYFQVGDNPGRNEPSTGEINYRNVFRHIHQKGFTGIVGMEHGKSQGGKDGERALIDAYRAADTW